MDEITLGLLEARRAALADWEESLQQRINTFEAARRGFWLDAQSAEVEEVAVRAVVARLQQEYAMEIWPDSYRCYHRAGDGTFASVDYLADTAIGDERWMALRLPFSLLWFLRARPRAFEVCILGRPERCLVLPGNDLWDWIGVRWRRWPEGDFSFVFCWHEEEERCELRTILQTCTFDQGHESHLCQQGRADVTATLNRFEWLGQI